MYYFNENLQVSLFNLTSYNNVTLNVTNVTGQSIKTLQFNGNGEINEVVPFAGYPAGVYIVSINADGNLIESKKFVVK